MFAKPNEIGSAESLTTEIENVAGSLRLNVALPFEARRYEFSLPAGEESLDASNEDEVPVLRRVIDTHAGEVIRTTSLPTVIKEVCIARFGGVRTSSEWFSARATLKPEFEGSTDAEVRNAIEAFEASNEAPVMTDGGEVVSLMPDREREALGERETVILSAIEEAVEEVGVVTTDRLKFWPAGEYDSDSPDLVALSGEYPEVPAAPEFDIPGKPAYRVREEFDAALSEALPAGIEFEHLGGMVTGFYGSPEVMTDGGRDEERHEREEQRKFDRMFASSMAPDDARYVMVCHHCGTGIWRQQDSAVVKRARRNEQPCECGGEFVLVDDARSEEYDESGELIEDGGERVMTDGGEEPTESGEESEEPVRWRDWSNVKSERNSERLMTDGGSRVHPDDEGVEILDSENDDGSDEDIIDAGDDGEIIADGGFGDVEEILETIEGFESERFRVRYRLEPMSDEKRFFATGPEDWRISSGVLILRNEEDSAHLSPSQVWDIREIPPVGECPECGSEMFPLEPSPTTNPKNSESGEYCCEACGFSMGPEDETVVIEYDEVAVNEEELREDNRFKSATFNDHGEIREIARQWVSGGDTFHRNEMVRCEECGRYSRSLATLLTWECSPIPDEEFVRQHTEALTDEAAVERAHELYFEEDAVPPGAKRIDNQLWEFAAMPDPARELIEELESMSGDAGYSGWSVERAGWHDSGTGDGHLWVKVEPIEGMYIGGYPEKCGTYSVPQAVINAINESRFYRVASVKASTSGEDVGSFRIEAEEDDRLLKLAMLEDAGEVPSIPLGGESEE